jgi:hypothetical protein
MNTIKEYGFDSLPFGELQNIHKKNVFFQETIQLHKPSLKNLNAVQYLSSVEGFVPKNLISAQNYSEMKNLASHFTGGITSFFGFESRLGSSDARADYLFAVSSRKGEREALAALIKNKQLPEEFLSKPEWQKASQFVLEWANPLSILYNNVLGLWFEFDMAENSTETPVPCIFIHAKPLRMDTAEDIQKSSWLTKTAIPMLTGYSLSEKLEQRFIQCIQQLPKKAHLFNIGVMLSRATSRLRLVIIRMTPQEIVPYLKTLGWTDENNGLQSLLDDVQKYASRIVLHISVTENGVEAKIGLECAFNPDRYHFETRWSAFFDYLISKNACLAEKKDNILRFCGVEQEDVTNPFNLDSYVVSAKIPDENFTSALVRYISHIKLNYKANQQLEAKAYPGVRLFGLTNKSFDGIY